MIVTRGLGTDTRFPTVSAGLLVARGYGGREIEVIQPPSIHEFVEGWGGVPIFVGIRKVRKKVS